ncbi:hypothetical protein V8B97DRAFT_1349602 [Scleroderma yunnanense]
MLSARKYVSDIEQGATRLVDGCSPSCDESSTATNSLVAHDIVRNALSCSRLVLRRWNHCEGRSDVQLQGKRARHESNPKTMMLTSTIPLLNAYNRTQFYYYASIKYSSGVFISLLEAPCFLVNRWQMRQEVCEGTQKSIVIPSFVTHLIVRTYRTDDVDSVLDLFPLYMQIQRQTRLLYQFRHPARSVNDHLVRGTLYLSTRVT